MDKVKQFINLIISKIGCGYVWGAQGETLDQNVLDRLINWFGIEHYHLDDGTMAEKWMGKQIFDCSGLIVWALQQLELISATDDYNTDGLLGLCTRLKDRSQLQPGDLVFGGNGNSTWHVGVYVGDGLTVQAECTAIGVVKTNWEQFNSWSMYGRLKCLKGEEVNNMDSIIKIGDVGSAVIELQEKLNTFGYNLIVDGDFGKATQTAVISFQQSRGLMADGIVGSCTQQALQQNGNNIEQPQEQPEPEVDWKKKYEDLLNQYYEMRQGLIDIINKYI